MATERHKSAEPMSAREQGYAVSKMVHDVIKGINVLKPPIFHRDSDGMRYPVGHRGVATDYSFETNFRVGEFHFSIRNNCPRDEGVLYLGPKLTIGWDKKISYGMADRISVLDFPNLAALKRPLVLGTTGWTIGNQGTLETWTSRRFNPTLRTDAGAFAKLEKVLEPITSANKPLPRRNK